MTMGWCQTCRYRYSQDVTKPCSECHRHLAIGVLVQMLIWNKPGRALSPGELTALDAIADLMGTATRLRREHNRELREESKAAQQDSRDAYQEGRDAERRAGGW